MQKGKYWCFSTLSALALAALAVLPSLQSAEPAQALRLRVSNMVPPNATDPSLVADLRIQQEFLHRNPAVELVRAEGIHLEGALNEVNTIWWSAGSHRTSLP